MRETLTLKAIEWSNQNFWINFIALSFPTAWDETTDLSLSEIIEETVGKEQKKLLLEWWDHFTHYDKETFNETDGYSNDPTTLVCPLTATQTLKLEFHPGDIVYFINDKQIASTGPHFRIQIFPFTDLAAATEIDSRIFLLLLPLTTVGTGEREAKQATTLIAKHLSQWFAPTACKQFATSIVYGLSNSD